MAAYVGHASVPTVAGPIALERSIDALADLDQFAALLHEQLPELATRVADEIIVRTDVLHRHPKLGRRLRPAKSIARSFSRCSVAPTPFLEYRYDGSTILMLLVFHSRESRG